MLVQAQATRVFFALSEAANPNNPVDGATFSGAEIRVVKSTTGAITNATNQAATANGGVDGGIIGVGGNTGLYSILLTAAELTLGLAAGAVGLVSLVVNKAGAVPRSILAWYVGAPAAAGGGDVTVAAGSITAIAAAVDTGVADNFAAVLTAISNVPAAPSAAANAAAVDTQLADNFTAVLTAVGAVPAAPSAGTIASAVEAILTDNFTALPSASAIATAVAAPSATAVRDAVWAQVSDGSPVLQRLTAAIALLLNKAQLPGEAGGATIVRDAADTKDRIVAAITAEGVRTVTTVDGTE